MNYYIKVLREYATFSGRATRSEYWLFGLFSLIIGVGGSLIIGVPLDLLLGSTGTSSGAPDTSAAGGIYALYVLATIVPTLAVSARRLHDIGLSGWLLLIGIVPYLGGLALFVMFCLDSTPGENRYGPYPKALPGQDRTEEAGVQSATVEVPSSMPSRSQTISGPPLATEVATRVAAPPIFCGGCGTKAPAGARYCATCGAEVI